MTRQEFEFFLENNLEDKGYNYCSLTYFDDKTRFYCLGSQEYAIEDVSTGNVEVRKLTDDEYKFINNFAIEELDAVEQYIKNKGYNDPENAFHHIINIHDGMMIWYIVNLEKNTGKVIDEQFVTTIHTHPVVVQKATDDDLKELDDYVKYCNNEVEEAIKDLEGVDSAELASVFHMKYKLYPDKYEISENGEKIKVCLMFDIDDELYEVGGIDVEDMEDDLKDNLCIACRNAIIRRLDK